MGMNGYKLSKWKSAPSLTGDYKKPRASPRMFGSYRSSSVSPYNSYSSYSSGTSRYKPVTVYQTIQSNEDLDASNFSLYGTLPRASRLPQRSSTWTGIPTYRSDSSSEIDRTFHDVASPYRSAYCTRPLSSSYTITDRTGIGYYQTSDRRTPSHYQTSVGITGQRTPHYGGLSSIEETSCYSPSPASYYKLPTTYQTRVLRDSPTRGQQRDSPLRSQRRDSPLAARHKDSPEIETGSRQENQLVLHQSKQSSRGCTPRSENGASQDDYLSSSSSKESSISKELSSESSTDEDTCAKMEVNGNSTNGCGSTGTSESCDVRKKDKSSDREGRLDKREMSKRYNFSNTDESPERGKSFYSALERIERRSLKYDIDSFRAAYDSSPLQSCLKDKEKKAPKEEEEEQSEDEDDNFRKHFSDRMADVRRMLNQTRGILSSVNVDVTTGAASERDTESTENMPLQPVAPKSKTNKLHWTPAPNGGMIGDDIYYLEKIEEIMSEYPTRGPPSTPTELLPHLYIGNQPNADNYDNLKKLGVTHVLNMAGTRSFDLRRSPYPEESGIVSFLMIPAEDFEDYNIMKHFQDIIAFIDSGKRSSGKTFVHCNLGVNRSGAACAAYLLIDMRWPLLQVMRMLKNKRSVILCNSGFRRQLVRFARVRGLLEKVEE